MARFYLLALSGAWAVGSGVVFQSMRLPPTICIVLLKELIERTSVSRGKLIALEHTDGERRHRLLAADVVVMVGGFEGGGGGEDASGGALIMDGLDETRSPFTSIRGRDLRSSGAGRSSILLPCGLDDVGLGKAIVARLPEKARRLGSPTTRSPCTARRGLVSRHRGNAEHKRARWTHFGAGERAAPRTARNDRVAAGPLGKADRVSPIRALAATPALVTLAYVRADKIDHQN